MLLSHQYIQRHCCSVVSPEDAARAQVLLELLFIKILILMVYARVASSYSSVFVFFSFFALFFFCVYFEYNSIININIYLCSYIPFNPSYP